MEEGKKSSGYFFSLEKQLKADHTIRVLTKDNMDTVTDPHDYVRATMIFIAIFILLNPVTNRLAVCFGM